MKTSEGLFEMAAEIERRGVVYYERLAEKVEDPRGSSLFKYLAEQEREHERLFMEGRNKFGGVEFTEPLPVIRADDIFVADILDNTDEVGATEYAIEVERRTADLYRTAAEAATDSSLKEFLTNLARIEEGHEKLLKDNLESLKSEGAWQGYVPLLEG
ncbi:MAG: ferritin family protein [Thermoplasmata archaeon]|nr:ferritin family protein [Thermoplasmata archaeon]RLF56174.1 MAG: hypothetical protein DRN28_01235 [Thermoplasmata archaeon]RLF71496.1 MAG: hypothetical protein DRN40_02345 [Thermoplasmata archaeon]RLF73932.1 MAG: hypothetical protein DRN55_01860 [Thermoplasmata archaeon]HDD59954.1 hypothetical protein [Euryarchaeota archaeon]